MTPEERELRSALDARSDAPSPEFRDRLSAVLGEGKPAPNFLPTIALVAAAVLTLGSIGILLMARQAQHSRVGPARSPAAASPTPSFAPTTPGVLVAPAGPIVLPDTAQLTAASGDVVWVLVHYQYLYRSTDRGQTWSQRPVPRAAGLGTTIEPEISFVSETGGWLSTGGKAAAECTFAPIDLWHTTDAGATWQDLHSSGIGNARCKQSLSFSDALHGYLGAWDQYHAPVIFHTSDGGQSWTASQPLPDPPGFTTQPGGQTLTTGTVEAFGSTLLVTAESSQQQQYVFRSLDGGATWAYVATPPNPGTAVAFVTLSRWLELIGPDQTVETTDGGATWHKYSSDYSQAAPVAPQFAFGNSQVGYATVRGGIQRTVDGGLHWTDIKTPRT